MPVIRALLSVLAVIVISVTVHLVMFEYPPVHHVAVEEQIRGVIGGLGGAFLFFVAVFCFHGERT